MNVHLVTTLFQTFYLCAFSDEIVQKKITDEVTAKEDCFYDGQGGKFFISQRMQFCRMSILYFV